MRVYVHERMPKRKEHLLVRALLILMVVLFCMIFLMGAFALAYYAHAFIPAAMLVLLPPAVALLGYLHMRDLVGAYAEAQEEGIVLVTYVMGRQKTVIYPYALVHHVEELSGRDWKLRGTRYPFLSYLAFYDAQGKQLFKLAAFPEGRTFKRFIFETKTEDCT